MKSNKICFICQYPDAKTSLMERGRQLLLKDGLLDEQALTEAKTKQETTQEKVERFGE